MIQKVIAIQDDSCHWYVIPAEMQSKFRELEEQMGSDNQNVYDRASTEFDELFGHCRTGGDLNNIQLYADL